MTAYTYRHQIRAIDALVRVVTRGHTNLELHDLESGAKLGLGDLDPHRKRLFDVVDVGYHDDFLEVVLNGLDGLSEPFLPCGVLGAETLVDE